MKNSYKIFLLCCALFAGNSLWANDTISFTWQGSTRSKGFTIQATQGETFTVNWGDGKDTTLTGLGITSLSPLYIYGKNNDYTVTITGNSPNCFLTHLRVDWESVKSLDISKAIALTTLNCTRNPLTALDVSKNTALTTLDCSNNSLTTLDVSQNTALTDLDCSNNSLTMLDVSQNTALTDLDCSNNSLFTLKVSQNTALTYLRCYNNRLSTLDISKNTALTDLNCNNNRLTMLDVSQNTALTNLNCINNSLSTLKVNQNTALTYLDCGRNSLTTLDISKNTALKYLDCGSNSLTKLDINQDTALITLHCYNNSLTTLDVNKNTILKYLDCSSNSLTTLYVRQNRALVDLNCGNNQLSMLDVSQNIALRTLKCYNNSLTSITGIENIALINLDCYNNALPLLDLKKASDKITYESSRSLGTQTLATEAITLHATIPADTVFNGVHTVFTVTKLSGTAVPEKDYSLTGGVITFKTPGFYTVEITNSGITSSFSYPAKVIASYTVIPNSQFPLLDDFESGQGNWTLVNGSQPNQWIIGTATAKTGRKSAYISNNGINNSYTTTSSSIVHLYRDITFAPTTGMYNLSFYWKGMGESGYDDLKVYLVDTTEIPVAGANVPSANLLATFSGASAWQEAIVAIPHTYSGTAKRLVFSWRNNDKWGEQTPVAIDNISIDAFCNDTLISFTWPGGTSGSSFTIRANSGKPFKIDWGDGQITRYTGTGTSSVNPSHTYINTNEYTVNVTTDTTDCFFTYLDVSYENVTSLDISKANTLTSLYCSNNRLSRLNISQNTALTTVACGNNQLSSLDLSKNTALAFLACYTNAFPLIDLKKISDKIAYTSNKYLGTQTLPSTTVVLHTAIPADTVFNGVNTVFTVGKLGDTAILDTDYSLTGGYIMFKTPGYFQVEITNPGITSYSSYPVKVIAPYIAGITEKQQFSFTWAAVSTQEKSFSINPTFGKKLTINWGDGTKNDTLTGAGEAVSITPSHTYTTNNPYTVTIAAMDTDCFITHIIVFNNAVSHLNVSKIPSLIYLDCSSNLLTSLDVSQNTALSQLYCYSNRLTSLDVSQNKILAHLYCDSNQLISLNVTKNTELSSLHCLFNELASLDVTQNTKLTNLQCSDNRLSSLDISRNTALTEIFCSQNKLPLLDLYQISQKVTTSSSKWFSPQTLAKLNAGLNLPILITKDTVLGGIATQYGLITKNGDTAVFNTDYTLLGNYITFKKEGEYTVEMSNSAIISSPFFSTTVIATFNVNNKQSQSITWEQTLAATMGDAPIILTAATDSGLEVAYTSSDTLVAAVSGNLLTIVGAGTATITAQQAGDTTYDAATEVQKIVLVIDPAKQTQSITWEQTLSAIVGDAPIILTATASSNLEVTYTSSDTLVAAVSGNLLTIVGEGTATITAAQAGDTTYNAATEIKKTLTVNPFGTLIAVTGISLNTEVLTLEIDEIYTLQATISPANATHKKITWTSSNENVVIVGSTGKIAAVAKGKAFITAATEDGGFIAECVVTVQGPSGIAEAESQKAMLKVYPNPVVNGLLTIEISEGLLHSVRNDEATLSRALGVICIYNLQGKLMAAYNFPKREVGETSIDISHLPNGVYWVKVGSENVKVIKK